MDQEQSQVTHDGGNRREYGDRSSRELKRDVDATRSEMDRTIDELVERIKPGELFTSAIGSLFKGGSKAGRQGKRVGTAASDVGSSLIAKIRDNPVPAALIAVGAAWLLMSDDDEESDDDEPYDVAPYDVAYAERDLEDEDESGGLRERIGGAASAAGSGARSMASTVGSGAKSAASAARSGAASASSAVADGAASVASAVTDTARGAARRARSGGRYASRNARKGIRFGREEYDKAMREYPLAVGGAALGLGLLCGLIVPETQREHELLGPARDDLFEKGQAAVEHAAAEGKRVARKTVAATQEKLQEEGLAPEQLSDKAKRIASHTREAVETELEEEGMTPRDIKEKIGRTAKHASTTAREETATQEPQSRPVADRRPSDFG